MKLTSNTLEKAIIFATEKHSGQVRKGNGMPYILHPLSVMVTLNKIKRSNNPELIAIVCLLHDVVEDCGVSLEEIAKEFGHGVASIVDELTSDEKEIAIVGKKQYLAHKMLKMSSYALRIKLADRLDNVQDITPEHHSKIEETKYILSSLKNRKLTPTHKKLIKLIEKKITFKNAVLN
jgi:(p)ppGpp synthase/HD superfamily hydrolase